MDWTTITSDVVGIGEECHGDLVSWRWRIDAVRSLAKAGRRVAVLCENCDFYVRKSRRDSWKFERHDDGCFLPNLVPRSNFRKEHQRSCREIAKHATCFGIDVQQLSFEFFEETMKKDAPILAGVLERHKGAWLARRSDDGSVRNELNGKIVAEMAVALRAVGFTSVLYFAQNEHVGRSSFSTIDNAKYLTDGFHISASPLVTYTAVATCAPRMWNTWTGRVRLSRCKVGSAALLPWAKKPFAIVPTAASLHQPLQLLNYSSEAFDIVIVDHRELKFA